MLSRLLSLESPTVIAHRGGSKVRPENTMLAFAHAVSMGVDAIECDVHLSRDGEVVVIHDETVDRTTDRRGAVSSFSAEELSRMDAGAAFGPEADFPHRARGVGVPRLAEVLGEFSQIPVIVEIKGDRPDVVERVLGVIRDANAVPRVILGGFSHRVMGTVRRLAPDLLTSASRVEVQSALRRSWLLMPPRRTGFALFQIPFRLRGRQVLRRHFVRVSRRAAIPVQAWIVDDPAEIRMLIDWGVTGLISDRPDVAIAVVRGASVI